MQDQAWLVRHAAMESLVEVVRSSDLNPRTLVPDGLMPGAAPQQALLADVQHASTLFAVAHHSQ
jgi:hypothetical protein